MKLWYVNERQVKSLMDTKEAREPVNVDGFFPDALKAMSEKYDNYGYVIFECTETLSSNEKVERVAEALHLGKPFVSPYNLNKFTEMFKEKSLNIITPALNSKHTVFDNSNGQGLHSDGTFVKIGDVKSTILFCEQEALEGGDTILFDTVNAFKVLLDYNKEWAEAMLHPEAFRRISSYNDGAQYIDSAFSILENGEIISRFSVDTTSDWEYGFERVPFLREAFGFLAGLSIRGTGFSTFLKLKSNQGILFANDKIAHGRTPFVDDSKKLRKMVRGLYTERPIV